MPEAVQRKHNTKVGTWGKITVLTGELKFIEMTEDGEELAEHIFKAGEDNPYAQPQAWHRVEALTDDIPPESEPVLCSVIPQAPIHSPEASLGSVVFVLRCQNLVYN